MSWVDNITAILTHPIDSLSTAFGSGPNISGPPIGGVDSLASAAVRAYGVDPVTGGLIAPQYSASAQAAGYDPSNPGAFVTRVENDAVNFYDKQLSANLAASADPTGMFVGIAIALVLGFFLWKAVKG